MIHDLLDVSRIRAGETLTLQFIPCDLSGVIHEVLEEMSIVHGDRFQFYSKKSFDGSWGCEGIRRAVENLVGNAVKYSTPNTPILVSILENSNQILISVHNIGNVIPAEDIPNLFLPHKRSNAAKKGNKQGWGLGLTLVKGVVEAHDGSVEVESSEEKGTTFTLLIPLK